jgi:MoaE-MoaD fusion protein
VAIRVLFFGVLRDIAGMSEDQLEPEPGLTLAGVFDHYARRFPRLAGLRSNIVVSANQEFAEGGRRVEDGDEIALLPPVSGGIGVWTQRVDTPEGHFFALTRQALAPSVLAREILRGEDGAVVQFEGVVRNNSKGRQTKFLEYDCYEPLAVRTMTHIGQEIAAKHEIGRIAMVHRLGRLEIGETSVAVVVSAPHRKAAFEAALEGINRLKKLVPIWKKEHFADGEVWVEGEWDSSVQQL